MSHTLSWCQSNHFTKSSTNSTTKSSRSSIHLIKIVIKLIPFNTKTPTTNFKSRENWSRGPTNSSSESLAYRSRATGYNMMTLTIKNRAAINNRNKCQSSKVWIRTQITFTICCRKVRTETHKMIRYPQWDIGKWIYSNQRLGCRTQKV